MQWFKRQDTFTKLALGYGLMAILVGFVGYQGNRGLGVVRDIANQLHDKHAIPLARLQSANTSLKEMARMTRNVILDTTFKNPEAVSRWVAGYEQFHTQFERNFAAYKNALGAGERGGGSVRMEKLARQLHKDQLAIIASALRGHPEEANFKLTESRAIGTAIDREFDVMFDRHLNDMQSDSNESTSVYRTTHMTILATTMAAAAVAFGFGLGIARLIARPLVCLERELAQVGIVGNELEGGARCRDEVWRVIEATRQIAKRIRIIVSDNRAHPESAASVTGSVDILSALAQEVAERRRAEAAMQEAKEAAEAASRAKGQFLANMSHEIRTPMNGVLGMLDLTLRCDIDPRKRELLGLARSSAETLLRLLNDILDFSKIEAGKLELEETPFGLRDTFGDAMKTLVTEVHKKGLELAYGFAPDVPDALVGDPGRLSQILVNLVGNACKFTERGEIAVRVDLESQAEEGVSLHIAVRDTGIGIAPEKQRHIFAAFTQADGSTTRRYGGTGLGLAISGHLVEAMGGRIWVESQLGQGSTFHFTARFGVHDGEVIRPSPRRLDLAGLPVLVVDDNSTNRKILQELLSHWGMTPTAVDGGRAALAAIQRASDAGEPYPLVLLDAMMPEMDGFAVAAQIHQDPELAGTAILMLSSTDLQGDTKRCRELNIAVYLRKPVKESDLLNSILSVLGVEQVTRAEPSSPRLEALPPGSRRLSILLVEDTPINQRLAVVLLEDRGHTVVVANDGLEALDVLNRESFDLVLMDVQMPRMDGFQATAAIRAGEAGTSRHIPIFAMTAHAMKGDRERCLAAGMDGYISKPIRAEQFLAVIEGRAPKADGPEPEGGSAARPGVAEVVFDLEEALARTRGKRELLRKMADLFLTDCPGLLAQIYSALATGDGSTLERAAHRIKGSAANLSAPRVVAVAGRLEEIARGGCLAEAEAACAGLEAEVGRLGHALEILKEEGAECAS